MRTEIKECGSIRKLKEIQAEALAAYHEVQRDCEARTKEIRATRGTKLKTYEDEEWYEEGRSTPRRNGNW